LIFNSFHVFRLVLCILISPSFKIGENRRNTILLFLFATFKFVISTFVAKYRMKQFTLFLLCFSPFFAFSQKRLNLVHQKAFAYYDFQEKAFCVLDDSSFIWKYNVQRGNWVKEQIDLCIDMPFAKFLDEFVPMSEKGTPVYFVNTGCGVVYMKRNMRVERHDHSFYHKNQFGGAYFMDEGEPRIYGGYGLFTSKNIITRYDTIEREWFMLDAKELLPPAGAGNIIQKYKQCYYLFDGLRGNANPAHPLECVWKYDLRTKCWSNLGELNREKLGAMLGTNFSGYQIQENGFFCYPHMILTVDFQTLRFRKYFVNSTGLYQNILKVGELYLVRKASSSPTRFIEVLNGHFLDQFEYEEGDLLVTKETSKSYLGIILVTSILALILLAYVLRNTRLTLNKTSKRNGLKGGKMNLEEFNNAERELIQLLITHQEKGLEISHINDLVNFDQPSMDTLKKRRELLLKDVRYKLATKFKIPQEDVFIERRMETDKRMKLLFLHAQILAAFQ